MGSTSAVIHQDKIRWNFQKQRVEEMLLKGVRNQNEMAAALGMTPDNLSIMMKEITMRWRDQDEDEHNTIRSKRVRQIDNLALLALNSFERSRQDSEEWTKVEKQCTTCRGTGTEYKKATQPPQICTECLGQGTEEHLPNKYRPCGRCKGAGEVYEAPECKECGGRGRIVIETTKTKGQAGDPAFLNVAKACFMDAAKLEGLVTPEQGLRSRTITQETRTLLAGHAGGQEVIQRVEEVYYEAPEDLIIRSMAALDEIRRSVRLGETTKIIEASTNPPSTRGGDSTQNDKSPDKAAE